MNDALPPPFDDAGLLDLRRDMVRFARLQLRDDAAAEDVVQDAIIGAMKNASGFTGRSQFKTWVFGILRHKIIDLIRSNVRTVNIGALTAHEGETADGAFERLFNDKDSWNTQAMPHDWGDPEESLTQQQFWTVFDACMEDLPENTARVFMMREFLELDTEEICRELQISISNCHVILHRARNGLRRCLEMNWFATESAA